jgi:hypothetical protein
MPEAVLSNLERRTLGNLSIPRNVDDIVQHLRPYDPAPADQVDAGLRNGMSSNGWVVNLGQHDNPAKLASLVQRQKAPMELPDDKADLYTRRMQRPDLAWRMSGDLWMLTEEGLAQLHAPTVDSPPLPPSQVQAVVDAEWARVLRRPFVEGKTSLANMLLEDEFAAWYRQVADECERVWNVRPAAPMGGGASGWSDAYEVIILDAENQKASITLADPWYMALSILAFTDADTGTTADNGTHIPTYTGYARKSVAGSDMPAASSGAGSAANTSAITFAACTSGSSTMARARFSRSRTAPRRLSARSASGVTVRARSSAQRRHRRRSRSARM